MNRDRGQRVAVQVKKFSPPPSPFHPNPKARAQRIKIFTVLAVAERIGFGLEGLICTVDG